MTNAEAMKKPAIVLDAREPVSQCAGAHSRQWT